MQIREFETGDTDAVVALWRDCDLLVPWNDPRQDIARKMQVGREFFLVGVENNVVIATVMGGYEGHRGWINYLAVAPANRRRGLGHQIMRAIEARLDAVGCPKINLQVRSSNEAVIEFYQGIGYARDDVVGLGKRLQRDA